MYTKFSGSNGQNARRWLRTLKYELPNTFGAGQWLECVDGLLEGDAALWADHHPRVKHILSAAYLREATETDKETFIKAIKARFPPIERTLGHSLPEPHNSIMGLIQAPNEDLNSYYQRALILLYQRKGVDLSEAPLTEHEREALHATIWDYIRGLIDTDVFDSVESNLISSFESSSLEKIHRFVKQAKRDEQRAKRAGVRG